VEWDLGDGTLLTRQAIDTVSHTYDSAGRKVIRLAAVDDSGASSTATLEIQVRLNATPIAGLGVTGTPQVNQDLIFQPTGSMDADGVIVRYDWDFGDGQTTSRTSLGAPLTHRYATAGNYTVSLTVTDNDGAFSVAQQTLTVTSQPTPNKAPYAQFSASLSGPVTGQEVSFNPSASTDPDGQIIAYNWNFGDGTTATTPGPDVERRTYTTPGIATVRLTVTDDKGKQS
jgi:YD repeat-containing protein